jgi:hypothetical protein
MEVCKVSGKPVTLESAANFAEIYPVTSSKVTQFERLKASSGIEYEDMLFFDNEAGGLFKTNTCSTLS